MPKLLLVLDDDRERLRGFEAAVTRLGAGWEIRTWRDAPGMVAGLEGLLREASLVSLDHDLYRDEPSDPDPGSGRVVADFLAKRPPRCPVIVHSTNTDAAWGMHNELARAGWTAELVHHVGQPDWIMERWLPVAKRMAAASPPAAAEPATRALAVGSILLLVLLVLSGLRPYDRVTWLMEVLPVMIVLPVLWTTRQRFPPTTLLYALIFVHACVLILGGAYTYARVPLGFALQEWLDLARNPYDRIGHFFQGFVPAVAAREILLRGGFVKAGRMLAFLVVCVVLAVSATYELVEWAAALALGQGAEEFLGTQGDPWDTQSDMFMALLGAGAALAILSRLHDRQLARIERP